jgi:hypothetical protein
MDGETVKANIEQKEEGSGISKYLDEAINMLAKVPVTKYVYILNCTYFLVFHQLQCFLGVLTSRAFSVHLRSLRTLISKYDGTLLPLESDDVETHINVALDITWKWSNKNGGWDALLKMLNEEIGQTAMDATKEIESAVLSANTLSESKLKELIKMNSSQNAVPKLDRKKYKGRLQVADYAAALIDVLREANDNDYSVVASILQQESSAAVKKGFGA